MLEVVHHEQDTGQQLIGHEEVMDIGASMPLTTVTGASFQQRTKILLVSKEEAMLDNINARKTQSNNSVQLYMAFCRDLSLEVLRASIQLL